MKYSYNFLINKSDNEDRQELIIKRELGRAATSIGERIIDEIKFKEMNIPESIIEEEKRFRIDFHVIPQDKFNLLMSYAYRINDSILINLLNQC